MKIEDPKYKRCVRCIMDTSIHDITFDDKGYCNYCSGFIIRSNEYFSEEIEFKNKKLKLFVDKVKREGKGKKYDCIIGVSGGVDSSWVLVQAVKLGLRPLAVHFNNGWNTELAESNIRNLVKILNVDLYTYKVNETEYNKVLQSFFDANVIDLELLHDNMLHTINYQQAEKYKLRYILSGSNMATEGLSMPSDWNWLKYDALNIRRIYRRFGGGKIKNLPLFSVSDYIKYEVFKKIHWFRFLDLMDFNKDEVLNLLERDYSYIRYPYKHYESIFTRFYQAHILPNKFGVDKRLVHLSTLVVAEQMSREQALSMSACNAYPSDKELYSDAEVVKMRMGWNDEYLHDYLKKPEVKHWHYGTEKIIYDTFRVLVRLVPLRLIKWLRH